MKLCYQLEEAISISSADDELAVFAKESGPGGKRHYLVASRTEFWSVYKDIPIKKHYEVITVGTPVKLFFDLEFDFPNNMNKDGTYMTDLLISLVREDMIENYGVNIEASELCILDSSTDKKFSKHVIFSSCIFTDCSNCGKYVNYLLSKLPFDVKENLSVLNNTGKVVLFIDQVIYSKNRNFRLFLSSKFGKNTPLTVCHTMKERNKLSDEAVFFQSLITNVQANDIPIPFDEFSKGKAQASKATDSVKTSDSSPYKEFDKFLTSFIKPGQIGNVIHYKNESTGCPILVYNVNGYRYCPNIQRCHKKNEIYFIANIRKRYIVQKCRDYDCSDFSSAPLHLDMVMDSDDDAELIEASEALERNQRM